MKIATATVLTLTLAGNPVPTTVNVDDRAEPVVELQPQRPAPVVPLGRGRKVLTSTVVGAAGGCLTVALLTQQDEDFSKRGDKCLVGALVGGGAGLIVGLWTR